MTARRQKALAYLRKAIAIMKTEAFNRAFVTPENERDRELTGLGILIAEEVFRAEVMQVVSAALEYSDLHEESATVEAWMEKGKLASLGSRTLHVLAFLLPLALVALTGCHSRLLGERHSTYITGKHNIQGVWSGSIQLDGRPQPLRLIIVQSGDSVTPDSRAFVSWTGTMNAMVTGSLDGATVSLTLDEGTLCVNKVSVSGEASVGDTSMVVTITAAGNDVPGTVCYPKPINQTVTVSRS